MPLCLKTLCLLLCGAFGLLPAAAQSGQGQPWTAAQLMAPATLAARLQAPASGRPLVIDVGPAGLVRGALSTGPAGEKAGMASLRALLDTLSRDREVVIYCGCCPFARCPNVRPAFRTLLAMGFRHPWLLNLPRNLKADWIDQSYPMAQP